LVGKTGHVITTIKGETGPGEIEIDGRGTYIAWSKERLPIGTLVLVISTRGVRSVSVEPFGA
jgi:membrane protein implicated in regulation of membrane protease activity